MSCESKSALRTDSGASDVAQLARENDHTEAAEWASTHASSTPLFARDGSDGAHLTTEEEVPRVAQSAASFYSTYVNPLRPCPPAWNWPAPARLQRFFPLQMAATTRVLLPTRVVTRAGFKSMPIHILLW